MRSRGAAPVRQICREQIWAAVGRPCGTALAGTQGEIQGCISQSTPRWSPRWQGVDPQSTPRPGADVQGQDGEVQTPGFDPCIYKVSKKA